VVGRAIARLPACRQPGCIELLALLTRTVPIRLLCRVFARLIGGAALATLVRRAALALPALLAAHATALGVLFVRHLILLRFSDDLASPPV
jgi:hypothetical protein